MGILMWNQEASDCATTVWPIVANHAGSVSPGSQSSARLSSPSGTKFFFAPRLACSTTVIKIVMSYSSHP